MRGASGTTLAAAEQDGASPASAAGGDHWPALAAIRVFALLWIILVHLVERVVDGWYIANPSNSWPPLDERVAQLQPLTGYGIWDIPLWLLASIGRAGDQGVQLFLILSGFGLTWALLRGRSGGPRWREFLLRRLSRIYPPYWMAHLFVLAGSFLVSVPLQSDSAFLFSLLGIRVTPGLLYAVSPPWWYIGLIVQLYLVFPLLWKLLLRLGWQRFLLLTLAASLTIRTVGLWVFADVVPQWNYLDAWARGAIFVSRLPEFVFGMALAGAAATGSPARLAARLRAPGMVLLAVIVYAFAMGLSAFLLGNGIAIFLLGASAFVLLFSMAEATVVRSPWAMRGVNFLSNRSYAIFLVHYAVIAAVIPVGAPISPRLFLLGVIAIVASLVLALLLETATAQAGRLVAAARHFAPRGKGRLAGAFMAIWLMLIAAELWVRHHDPQEVNGWGERASLQEDPDFGWRLIPDRTTRLRWLGYDYEVTANALGFPGPLYPADRPQGALRVMTIGDAFTSAEGVDTDAAWPRLLERDLAARVGAEPVQVQNFAITGFGPDQYVAVARAYLPIFRPDAVVVTLFVNEFQDVSTTNRQFQRSIGFGKTPAEDLYAVVTLGHLSVWAQNELRRVLSLLRGKPAGMDAQHSQLNAFRPGLGADDPQARERVLLRLAELRDLSVANGARLLLLLVPANIQVCSPDELYTPPTNFDLSDAKKYDLERPQRVLASQASLLDIPAVDLRPVLRNGACPYRQHNMHWSEEGHRRVAAFVADWLVKATAGDAATASMRAAARR